MMRICNLVYFLSLFCLLDLLAQNDPENSIAKITAPGKDSLGNNVVSVGGGIVVNWDQSDNVVYIVSAYHIVENADSIKLEFHQDRRTFSADIFKIDRQLDLVIISAKITGAPISFEKQVIAESSEFQLSLVQIIGQPPGFSWVVKPQKFGAEIDGAHFFVSRDGLDDKSGKGFSGGGVFTKNNRLMGMMIEIRSHDILAVNLSTLTSFLNDNRIQPNLLTRPKLELTPLVIMGAGTAGILVSVLGFENESSDLYSTYEGFRFPNDPIYKNMGMSREEVYQEANSKHHKAIIIGAISGTVFAVGSYMLIRKLSKRARERKFDGLAVIPHFDMPNYALSAGNYISFGVTLRF